MAIYKRWTSKAAMLIRAVMLLASLFAFSVRVQGQIQVQMRPINPFHFTPEQSWEMDVISVKEKSFRVKVFARISTKSRQAIADLKSYVYDPVSLKLVAELDENNYATFYEYDEEGTLLRTKKETEKGIVTITENRQSNPKQ